MLYKLMITYSHALPNQITKKEVSENEMDMRLTKHIAKVKLVDVRPLSKGRSLV